MNGSGGADQGAVDITYGGPTGLNSDPARPTVQLYSGAGLAGRAEAADYLAGGSPLAGYW